MRPWACVLQVCDPSPPQGTLHPRHVTFTLHVHFHHPSHSSHFPYPSPPLLLLPSPSPLLPSFPPTRQGRGDDRPRRQHLRGQIRGEPQWGADFQGAPPWGHGSGAMHRTLLAAAGDGRQAAGARCQGGPPAQHWAWWRSRGGHVSAGVPLWWLRVSGVCMCVRMCRVCVCMCIHMHVQACMCMTAGMCLQEC